MARWRLELRSQSIRIHIVLHGNEAADARTGDVARQRKHIAVKRAAQRAAEVFLRRRLFRRVSDGRIINAEFVLLHYPLYYHYDFLGGLKAMTQIGCIGDPRCIEALELLEHKRLPDGGWPAEKRFYRTPTKTTARTMTSNVDYVKWGETSKRRLNEWVTVDALSVLRAAGRLDA